MRTRLPDLSLEAFPGVSFSTELKEICAQISSTFVRREAGRNSRPTGGWRTIPNRNPIRKGPDSWIHPICSRELAWSGCLQIRLTSQVTANLTTADQLSRGETLPLDECSFLPDGIFALGPSASINEGRN